MAEGKTTSFTMRIGAEEKARFMAKCESEGRNPSALIRKFINDWANTEGVKKQEADYQGQQLQLAVNLPAELRREFAAVCHSEGYSTSAIVRKLITQWLDENTH